MPRPRSSPLFELGGQWIATDPASRMLYRFWYDSGIARTRRASLGTTDIEQAKLKLAEIVISGAPKTPDAPLSVVLESYFTERTDRLPSKDHARLAGRLLLSCWGQTIRVKVLDGGRQGEFVAWSVERGHSLSYISRNLSVLAAALRHAKLDIPITYGQAAIRERWPLAYKARQQRFIPSDDQLAKYLSADMPEDLWRWTIIQLCTGGRPQTGVDLAPALFARETATINLNPLGRSQNKKFRPIVRAPKVLVGWLDRWEREAGKTAAGGDLPEGWRYCRYATLESVQTALERVRADIGLPHLSAYSFRHKVASVLRQAKRSHGVTEDDIAVQLGHTRPHLQITAGYGEWDPDYLLNAARAIDAWFGKIQRKVKKRALFSQGFPKSISGRKKRAA